MPTAYYRDTDELRAALAGTLIVTPDGLLTLVDEARLRGEVIDRMIGTAVFHPEPGLRNTARRLIQETAPAAGAFSASIQPLYAAVGRGECGGFTVPAINARTLTYDLIRAAYRVGHRIGAGPLIFEIARSEMGYAHEPPAEYGPTVLAAAIKEGVRGPVFIQGDHFQVNAARYTTDPDAELAALRTLIDESLAADFRNIDIDSSTLVDLSLGTLFEQQHANAWVAAELTAYIRSREPHDLTVSVGGEIGEVGKKNTTVDELRAYMKVYLRELEARGVQTGISKISVQTGTSHGGVVRPDGTVAEAALDFGTLETISKVARLEYGLSGAVQHGASTLPDDLFHRFPGVGAAEIHLATGFQNLILDSPEFPSELWRDMA
ncbi:MAG: class II fructose-bisphosphate aldolase, partial [Chloroflexi bacterium]|nr:class II fructose-bisphosphate aldolase [Chloroflexota bacterium]